MSLNLISRVALSANRHLFKFTQYGSRAYSTLLPRRFTILPPRQHVLLSSYNCSQARTKGDEELASFLVEEIESEKKLQKRDIPKIGGFEIKTDGAEVQLHGKFNNEQILVTFNVNHSVDAEMEDSFGANEQQSPQMGEMKAKPNFDVEIVRGGQKLFFSCTFVVDDVDETQQQQQDQYNDLFSIVEFSMYQGEASEKVYSVSGDIMDGYLYDLLMNMLEERGISNEFAEQLTTFATAYEHSLYIRLLENLKSFVAK